MPDHVVFVVDDDPRVREGIEQLLSAANLHAVTFGSAAEYLHFPKPDVPGCLVLDIKLPDANGMEFHRNAALTNQIPVIFITGYGDIPSSVRAIKAGAVDFLTKPFSERQLLDAITAAIAMDRTDRQWRAEEAQIRQRYELLTPREREVFPLVVSGMLNKQSAAKLGISEITLQIHRSKVMRKMEASSLADLVRLAERLDVKVTGGRGTHDRDVNNSPPRQVRVPKAAS